MRSHTSLLALYTPQVSNNIERDVGLDQAAIGLGYIVREPSQFLELPTHNSSLSPFLSTNTCTHPQTHQHQLGPPLGALLYAYMGFRNLNLVLGAIPLAELLAFPFLARHIPSAAKGAGASDSVAPTPACTPSHVRERQGEVADVVPRSRCFVCLRCWVLNGCGLSRMHRGGKLDSATDVTFIRSPPSTTTSTTLTHARRRRLRGRHPGIHAPGLVLLRHDHLPRRRGGAHLRHGFHIVGALRPLGPPPPPTGARCVALVDGRWEENRENATILMYQPT